MTNKQIRCRCDLPKDIIDDINEFIEESSYVDTKSQLVKLAVTKYLNDMANHEGDEKEGKTNKRKIYLYINKNTEKKFKAIKDYEGYSNNSVTFKKIIDFYFGYLTENFNEDHCAGVYKEISERHFSKLQSNLAVFAYKIAVEVNILTKLVASLLDISREQYNRIRKAAEKDVSSSNGIIDIGSEIE